MIQTDEATAPAAWASYLVNGDASGLEPDELSAADAWCARLAPWYVVDAVEDSNRFSWSYRLHGGTAEGGTVCDYILHREESASCKS